MKIFIIAALSADGFIAKDARHAATWTSKEDKQFFIPFMTYFNKQEQDNMLRRFCKFDNTPIQEAYRNIVIKLEKDRIKNK